MTKNFYLTIISVLVLALVFISQTFATENGTFCFPEGCMDIDSTKYTGGGKVGNWQQAYDAYYAIAAAAKPGIDLKTFTGSISDGSEHGNTMTFVSGIMTNLTCNNGLMINFRPGCQNGATNPPACNICPTGAAMLNNQCACANGATGSQCNICPAGQTMINNLCMCANGATNPTACNICPAGSNMISGMCTCTNNADVFTQCNSCRSGQVFDNAGICRDACDAINVCGQTKQGFMFNGQCVLSTTNGEDPNASCIVNFNVTTNRVNPNGSVEFSWSLANLPANIRSVCGFVDLTTPTPRPIPGLQNLSPETDRTRINNVQATTRFCLVCKFTNLLTNTYLGEAAKHQWVRVIKVGEN